MTLKTEPIPPTADIPLRQRVQNVLDTLRPLIQWDGGDVELIDITPTGVVSVRFRGACVGCPSSQATLRLGIEKNLREKVPEVTQVISIEDAG